MNTRDLLIMVAALEICLHYFPWRMMLGRKLPRLAAYTLGLLAMMGPFTLWLIDRNEGELAITLWMVIATAGLTVDGVAQSVDVIGEQVTMALAKLTER